MSAKVVTTVKISVKSRVEWEERKDDQVSRGQRITFETPAVMSPAVKHYYHPLVSILNTDRPTDVAYF